MTTFYEPVENLTLAEIVKEIDGLIGLDDQIYDVRDRVCEDFPDYKGSSWDHHTVGRYSDLTIELRKRAVEISKQETGSKRIKEGQRGTVGVSRDFHRSQIEVSTRGTQKGPEK